MGLYGVSMGNYVDLWDPHGSLCGFYGVQCVPIDRYVSLWGLHGVCVGSDGVYMAPVWGLCVVTTGSVWALYGVCMGFLQGLYRASMGQSRAVTLIYYSQPLRSVPELPHTSTPLLWGRQHHLGSPVSLWDHPFRYTASEVPMRLPMSLWGP